MGISFGGLASGLDTNAIISAILSVEQRPIQLLSAQKSNQQSKISLFGTLEGLISALQDRASGILSGGFFAQSITASDESVATFSLIGDAPEGAHDLQVHTLASADRYAFDGVPDADAPLGSGGTVDFTYDGKLNSVTVAPNATLNDVAAAINTEAGDDVTASVVNVGTDASPSYRLVIAGDDTGTDFQITGLASSVPGLANPTELTSASDASITIDGLDVVRSSNVFDDVIQGVSFTVLQAGDATGPATTSFNVEVDNAGTKENVQGFIDAYNDVISFINQQNSFDPDSGAGGDLFGDPALSSIRRSIASALFDVDIDDVIADTAGFSTLGLVGVDLQTDGTLKLDESKFDAKLAQDRDALADLFTNSTDGVLVKLDTELDELLKGTLDLNGEPIDGVFDRRTDTLNRVIASIDKEVERLEFNLEKLEENLIQRFANLESLLSGLNSQQAFLSSNLAFPSFE